MQIKWFYTLEAIHKSHSMDVESVHSVEAAHENEEVNVHVHMYDIMCA